MLVLPRTFLLVADTYKNTNILFHLFYSVILTNPRLDNFQFKRTLREIQSIYPLFAITSAGSALIVLRSSVCWIRQQLDK